jgi:muramoyltetrapeptide carboxypeptidase
MTEPVTRRGLLRAGAAVAGGAALGASFAASPASAAPSPDKHGGPVLRGPRLKPGDRVRIVAPAYPGDGRLVRGQAILESFGLLV